jgi:uncharacterized protein (TIGR03435 family)
MKPFATALALVVIVSAVFLGQSPAFEVASIKPSKDLPPQGAAGLQISPGQVRGSFFSLRDYIGIAYGLRIQQVIGPAWIESARFEITAKLPQGATPDQVPAMLQTLLSERFHLASHRENRDLPVFMLAVASTGLKMTKTQEEPPSTTLTTTFSGGNPGGVAADLGNGSSLGMANNRIEAKKVGMEALANFLTRFVGRPVIDATNVAGRFEFTLDLAPEDYQGMMIRGAITAGIPMPPEAMRVLDRSSMASLIASLNKVGLDFQARRAPVDVLVIDRVERPTED